MARILFKLVLVAAVAVGSGYCGGEEEDIQAALAAAKKLKPQDGDAHEGTWSKDVGTWQAPKEMAKELPYYLSGYDFEHRPVLIMELGKWDIRKFVDAGGDTLKAYEKYSEQFWWRVTNVTSKYDDAEDGVDIILDCDGFTNRQMTSVAAIQSHLHMARISALAADNVAEFIMINVNFAIRTWVNLLRSISGPLFGRVDMYGTRKETWIPELRRKIPKDQLPPWYGGSNDFKPVQVFG